MFEGVVRKFTEQSSTEFKHTGPVRAAEGNEPLLVLFIASIRL